MDFHKRDLIPLAILLLMITAAILVSCQGNQGSTNRVAPPETWPTRGWQTSTPEEQGLDSAGLADALLAMKEQGINIHDLLIIRNGKILLDAVFYPYDGKVPHEVASVTKSIMTTLIGIAAGQGKLDPDQPMVSYFPNRSIANLDAQKEKITLRHLASLSSGLDSVGVADNEGTLAEMVASPDYVKFALDRRVVSEPGKHFVYDSPSMHLLSAILQGATGMTTEEFARQNLLEPLGIQETIWPADPQGVSYGWSETYFFPQDIAKIGLLFLNNGAWDGQQIVPQEWVEQATRIQAETGTDDNYGYGWWIYPGEPASYGAFGRGGQYLRIAPSLNLMVVAVGSGLEWDQIEPLIVPALVNMEKPLPANPSGMQKLQDALTAIQQPPDPQPVAPLPPTAALISGVTYKLEPNALGIQTVRLDFDESAEASMLMTFTGNPEGFPSKIGLDGVYRMSPGEYGHPTGQRGYWADEQTFVMEYDRISNHNAYVLQVRFEGDQVEITAAERSRSGSELIKGKAQN